MGGRHLRGLGRVQRNIEMEDTEERTGERTVTQQQKDLGSNEDKTIFVLQLSPLKERESRVSV